MRISDWSSDVCSSDLADAPPEQSDEDGSQDENEEGEDEQEGDEDQDSKGEGDQYVDTRQQQDKGDGEDSDSEYSEEEFDSEGDTDPADLGQEGMMPVRQNRPPADLNPQIDYNIWRSAGRRVGKACVSTCRNRWSPSP